MKELIIWDAVITDTEGMMIISEEEMTAVTEDLLIGVAAVATNADPDPAEGSVQEQVETFLDIDKNNKNISH